jgi:hypothetical protein
MPDLDIVTVPGVAVADFFAPNNLPIDFPAPLIILPKNTF